MLNVNRNYWFFLVCFLGFAAMLQLQAQIQNGHSHSSTSTQNDTSKHTLIPNYPIVGTSSSTYTYGESSSFYQYGTPMISSEVSTSSTSNETYHYGESKETFSSTSRDYQTPVNEYVTSSTDDESGSFVDEILDLPSMNPPSNEPQQRVVPVATVEDVHSIDRTDFGGRIDREGYLDTPKEDDSPATRVVPVATVEDVHEINRRDLDRRFDRHGSRETTPREDENPATRVVPVATVEDVHEVKTDHNDIAVRRPYENQNPIVQPVSVERESAKERRQRQETTPQYPSANYRPPMTEDNRETYTIEAEPKPKKRNFFEFIKDTFNEGNSNSDYKESRSRPSRSESSSSSSKEYKGSSSSSSSDSSSTTRTTRKSRDSSSESQTRESRSSNN